MSIRVLVTVVTLGGMLVAAVSAHTFEAVLGASQRQPSTLLLEGHFRHDPSGEKNDERELAIISPRDLFIRARATASEAYENEQIVVEYHLFYRPEVRLRNSRLAEAWDAPGFWREELDVPSRPVPKTRRVDGRVYQTIVLKRVALFPTRPGTLWIDPLRVEAEAQGTVEVRGATVRGRFKPVRLAADSLRLSIRPLPPAAPSGFDGAVGRFTMTTHIETDSLQVGGAVQFRVQLRGDGNLATLSPPDIKMPAEFEVYDPEVQTKVDRGGNQIRGTKTFTYTLVPRSGGTYALPPVEFSYFDPVQQRYKTLRSAPPPLHVVGDAPPRVVGRTGEGLPVGTLTDLKQTEEARWVRADRPPLYRRLWVYVALLAPVLAGGGGLAYRRWGKGSGRVSVASRADGRDPVQKHLRRVRKHRQGDVDLAFYDALEKALRTFLDERLSLNGIRASRAAIEQRLTHHKVPKNVRESLFDLLRRCREAQFGSDEGSPESADVALDQAETLLRRLDEALPNAASINSQR